MTHQRTIKYRKLYYIFLALSMLTTLIPMAIFVVKGYIQGSGGDKAILTVSMLVALCISCINIVFKLHLRSALFVVFIGVYVALDSFLPLLITFLICTIIDELILTPLKKRFKAKYIINKEVDQR